MLSLACLDLHFVYLALHFVYLALRFVYLALPFDQFSAQLFDLLECGPREPERAGRGHEDNHQAHSLEHAPHYRRPRRSRGRYR